MAPASEGLIYYSQKVSTGYLLGSQTKDDVLCLRYGGVVHCTGRLLEMPVQVQAPFWKSQGPARCMSGQSQPARLARIRPFISALPSAAAHAIRVTPGAHLVAQASSNAFCSSGIWQVSWVRPCWQSRG